MNAGNYSLFKVTDGNTYEWSYCESDTGVPLTWDAQLTLYKESNISSPLCFVKDYCGLAPKINWKVDETKALDILTLISFAHKYLDECHRMPNKLHM